MREFMDDAFVLETETARAVYEGIAGLPIIDFHCHLNPEEIARDKKYRSITEVMLGGDHYKWRAMRFHGIDERLITGDADDREKFRAWAETMPNLIGNPLYHWTHMELRKYFGIREPLSPANADRVFDLCNERLAAGLTARRFVQDSNVEVICTTDDPSDSLEWHRMIREAGFSALVVPSFRPDKAVNVDLPGFRAYVEKLAAAAGAEIRTFDDLLKALSGRLEFFCANGCRISDHALEETVFDPEYRALAPKAFAKAMEGETVTAREAEGYRTAVLVHLAGEYARRGVAMQLHIGCIRNINSPMFGKLGPDTGYDAVYQTGSMKKLSLFLDEIHKNGGLPRTILYSLDENSNRALLSVCTSFSAGERGKVQLGPAWWFNDTKQGMEKQLRDFADLACLGDSIGMLTDSRSFLSYTRHDYYRRILANFLGGLAEKGECPGDVDGLIRLASGVAYHNARSFLGFM